MDILEALHRIEQLLKTGHTREARSKIDELIHLDPNNAEIWYWRGVCEKFEGESSLAENDFRSVVRQNPNHDRAWYGLGVLLENKGNLGEAIAAYRHAASLGHQEASKKLLQQGASYTPEQQPRSIQSSSHQNSPRQDNKKTELELNSERGIDYTRLRNLLSAGNWKEADHETARVMQKVVQRSEMQIQDIENFPCTDLHTIDQLWVQYSQGRFGFSIQKKIYESSGGLVAPNGYNSETWAVFAKRVSWYKIYPRGLVVLLGNSNLTFALSAPVGHLPGSLLPSNNTGSIGCFTAFASSIFAFLGGIVSLVACVAICLILFHGPGILVGIVLGMFGWQYLFVKYLRGTAKHVEEERKKVERLVVAFFYRLQTCGL